MSVLNSGDVGRDARNRLGLDADLDVPHVLGLDRRRRQHRPAQRVGRHAIQVEADGLEAGGVGGVRVHRLGDLVGHRHLARQVRVVDVGRVRLRCEHRPLQRDEHGVGGLQAAVDLLIEVHVLLVVVEPQARHQPQAVGDRPFELAERRGTGVAILQELV